MSKRIYNLNKQSSTPSVGIFWIYKGQIVAFPELSTNIQPIAGFIDTSFEHAKFWPQVQTMFPELKNKEYYDVPRGRVTGVANGTYNVLLPTKFINNRIVIHLITKKFELPPAKINVSTDTHYNPMNQADEDNF